MIAQARAAMADFLHCGADEVIFGPNMTTLTYAMSRAIGRELKAGDEILLTRLDHDANVSPWLAMAEDRGLTVRWVDFHDEDCTLDMQDLASKINKNTKLVAVGYASNAVGTINPVKEIVRLAHLAGALAYIDAVHYGPHGLIDVAALDCDSSACSTYKFFGPHMGVLFGKRRGTSSAFVPTKFAPIQMRFPTAGNGARLTTNASRNCCVRGIHCGSSESTATITI